MRYPEGLVNRYGAKAGMLLYVAREIPEIPQAAMVVNEPGESIDDFLKRADEVPILWPRLFRSSAVAELVGYEGVFPTEELDGFEAGHKRVAWNPNKYSLYRNPEYFERGVRETIRNIKCFPRHLKVDGAEPDLPDEINVIIVEKAPSEYAGTLVKHPNQDESYLIAVTSSESLEPIMPGWSDACNPERSGFSYNPNQGLKELERFSQRGVELTDLVKNDLQAVISWHDMIASLPEMDNSYTYQLEFGIDPPCLFQIRPFLKKQRAGFELKPLTEWEIYNIPIVFGITSPEGLDLRVETDVWNRKCYGEEINADNKPSVYMCELRDTRNLCDVQNLQATILVDCLGILTHGDIGVIRRSQVSALYRSTLFLRNLEQGSWVNIVSDGTNVQIKRIKSPK